jgi:(S)-2-hydroxyglutarate dehydrogenase
MQTDIIVVGGGIVGLSTAHKLSLKHPEKRITLLEKESKLAQHQTGRNSGVIHSGIYYKPGSFKALTCLDGRSQLIRYCEEHGVAYDICGKVIVALDESELPSLQRIYDRGVANGVACELIDVPRIKELEPSVAGIRGIQVRDTGIVDYLGFCQKVADGLTAKGHSIILGSRVECIHETPGGIRVDTSNGPRESSYLVNCAGLYSDRVAQMSGIRPKAKIVPFRGEYYELKPEANRLCKNLIYPVPDPSFPFLGVHFTRMIHGGVECGPNAVLAFAREGYHKTTVRLPELLETLTYRGFQRIATRHFKMGLGEMHRSVSKGAFVRALQRLIPDVRAQDLTPIDAGVRAQAVLPDGTLLDDFSFEETARSVHVVNAVSPAATAALAIGDQIVERLGTRF